MIGPPRPSDHYYYSIFALSLPVVIGVGRQRKCDDHSGLRVWPPHVVVRIRPPDGQTVPRQATPTARIPTMQSPTWKPAAKFGILNKYAISVNENEDRRVAASASAQSGMRLVPRDGDNHGQGQC